MGQTSMAIWSWCWVANMHATYWRVQKVELTGIGHGCGPLEAYFIATSQSLLKQSAAHFVINLGGLGKCR